MKRMIIYLFIIAFSTPAVGQTANRQNNLCALFHNLTFKNGADTLIIKVKYGESFKSSDYSMLKGLDSERRIKYSEFGVDTGEEDNSAAISFSIAKCPGSYIGTLSRKTYDTKYAPGIKFNRSTLRRGSIVYLTCVVFDGAKYTYSKNTHFFVIIDVSPKKPPGFK